jgi:hypothetical protein
MIIGFHVTLRNMACSCIDSWRQHLWSRAHIPPATNTKKISLQINWLEKFVQLTHPATTRRTVWALSPRSCCAVLDLCSSLSRAESFQRVFKGKPILLPTGIHQASSCLAYHHLQHLMNPILLSGDQLNRSNSKTNPYSYQSHFVPSVHWAQRCDKRSAHATPPSLYIHIGQWKCDGRGILRCDLRPGCMFI